MGHRQKIRWAGLFLAVLFILTSMSTPFREYLAFPSQMRLFSGHGKEIHLTMPATATVTFSDPSMLEVKGAKNRLDLRKPFTVMTKNLGRSHFTLRLFGKLPLKKVMVEVLPDVRVIPGGQSIGVKLKSKGVLVVGHHMVQSSKPSPGEKADIRIGDLILEMDGKRVTEAKEIGPIVDQAGKEKKGISVLLQRGNEQRRTTLIPEQDPRGGSFRIGLYVRDTAAGVGTLTFYDPKKKSYGALGHVITDVDTGKQIQVGGGKIVHSNVTSIQKGASGDPGEKRAIFFREDQVLGSIARNTPFGVFGRMEKNPDKGLYQNPVPVALAEEVKEGPAQILTVVQGQKVERYDIEIAHLIHQKFPATKGMIIKVTDPRLLNKTGGIVQGMSGSPIMQDGKLVGAVTHVFVNDPTSGYGTYIEWMLKDAGVLETAGFLKKPAVFFGKSVQSGRNGLSGVESMYKKRNECIT
ncbi:SpoIVB peptidase [Desmospora profundinema]|uniref:Stage IV sporulation protein B n=1 Tax=Desmospora profundinema TaxID=1571184 RepID=A0ABU1IIQ4_9BACL|nr:SpoIVB peptidase [Desmospora profundinema]MDR6224636.1 stage IV sporulation protein B [Desmospora profundinema]